jgi:hypothetical protein
MRVTSVELHADGSSAFVALSFRDPTRLNPYNVKGITGLDADEIVPRFYGTPGTTAFYNMMLGKRTVVARIELNPRYQLGETPSSLRDVLYKMIASSRKGLIHLHFLNDAVVEAQISGIVRKVEVDHFTSTPEVQITIECTEPMLKAPDEVSLNVVGLDPSSTNIEDLVSTAPHGFKFAITFTADTPSFLMEDPADPDWSFEVTPATGFDVGDVLYYSSEYNDKYLYIIRGGNTIHLADVIVANSVWPVMFPGANEFTIADGVNMDWTSITYYPTFWGV